MSKKILLFAAVISAVYTLAEVLKKLLLQKQKQVTKQKLIFQKWIMTKRKTNLMCHSGLTETMMS